MPAVIVPTGQEPEYGHPLDIFERVASELDITYERVEQDSLTFESQGQNGDYFAELTWLREIDLLSLSSPLALKVPKHRELEFKKLLTLFNEQIWVGHFDFWSNQEQQPTLFRYSLLLPADTELSVSQCRSLSELPAAQWDHHYQAFHFVIWAGKTAEEAMQFIQFQTQGEA